MCYNSGIMKTEMVTTLKREATRLISGFKEDSAPVLITEHGRPAAYLVDVDYFEQQQARIEVLESIARGEQAFKQGRVASHEQAKKRMQRWLD